MAADLDGLFDVAGGEVAGGDVSEDSDADARQVGSVFLNPRITDSQAARRSTASCPVHLGSDGELRASAGWLLEFVGCRPGQPTADSVRCSERRTLTVTAHGGATSAELDHALASLAARVETATGIALQPEPTRVGRWPVTTYA
ncbi:hypothetical protein ACFRMQ_14770 [Kitasatospora sp. NPDC056783]|uniref:hypothetical protein n=1 Tax=Kitasatospora sp. NPDC056783 TaxID=3345943 RepID=UPI00368D9693